MRAHNEPDTARCFIYMIPFDPHNSLPSKCHFHLINEVLSDEEICPMCQESNPGVNDYKAPAFLTIPYLVTHISKNS